MTAKLTLRTGDTRWNLGQRRVNERDLLLLTQAVDIEAVTTSEHAHRYG